MCRPFESYGLLFCIRNSLRPSNIQWQLSVASWVVNMRSVLCPVVTAVYGHAEVVPKR